MTKQEQENTTKALELVYNASTQFSQNQFPSNLVTEATVMIEQIKGQFGYLADVFGQDHDKMLRRAIGHINDEGIRAVVDLANRLYKSLRGTEPKGVMEFGSYDCKVSQSKQNERRT